ncbi:putative DNA recombinase [Klebsiella pneumoniae hvKP1]|uniref:Uncharacterized protein n=3 Tax=Klebsiella pneumoniae TaxID=573 RepID=A0A8F7KNV6_KLEPN|nr:putative DNA recombinase [Klebsiella pneumoniae CG43]AMA27787.1 DNA recombinase [Klebsiella pneumoniae subsp. pneumoniae]AOE34253.1 DNA recombinase [Klebsiella pneumoniae]EMB12617.1 putative DNA recombinase [Klebsiella pneumoniae hvKP1]OED24846.1 DNA recombinase [Klebsiella quasipneumoniae]UNB12542.1 hypothetical protein [Escherichia coli]BAH66162.1 putative DNA recombinase [Klebsiella pneumoniae subsp. pneumoniae NTUH-K2044]
MHPLSLVRQELTAPAGQAWEQNNQRITAAHSGQRLIKSGPLPV